MSATTLLKQASAMVVGLAVILSTSATFAQDPLPAQTGIIVAGGSQVSGGTINYGFALTTTEAGSLSVKASMVLGKWKPVFPNLISTPSVGASTVTGPTINIPTNVVGKAKLKVQVKFNGKSITKRAIYVMITTPPPPASIPTVSTNLYEVGFENTVTLDGSIVSTVGLGSNPAYSWTQLPNSAGGLPPGMLSAANVAAPTLTTAALSNFVDFTTQFGTPSITSIDSEQITESTYIYRVLVSGNSITRTGVFTITCASMSPGQPNIPVGAISSIIGQTNSTSWTLLAVPAGSAATLMHTNSLTPQLRPDVEGNYIIQDNVTGATVTNTAASWTGGQFCAICHGPDSNVNQPDIVKPWSQTKHASKFQRMIDGNPGHPELGNFYSESCIPCHTVGYNKAPLANNGGFDDIATALGWKFPSLPMKPGNYTNGVPDALKAVSNIQCESCHGPGSRHPGAPSVTLDVGVCAQCHQDGHYHIKVAEWETSPHFQTDNDPALGHAANNSCSVKCHVPQGFVDFTKGRPLPAPAPNNLGKMTCAVCHDPHNVKEFPDDAHQVRAYDSVVLGDTTRTNGVVRPDGTVTNITSTQTITGVGPAATCMTCHNARTLPYQNVGTLASPKPAYMTSFTHESSAADVLTGVGGADNGNAMGNSFHTYLANCTTCHMYKLRPPDGNGNPQDTIKVGDDLVPVTAAVYAKYAELIGDHTYRMSTDVVIDGVTNEVQNIAACNQCHTEPVTDFDFQAVNARDYDGNGVIEGVQTEVDGLLSVLSNKLADVGVTASDAYPFVVASTYNAVIAAHPAQAAPIRRALWNRALIERELSHGVHNTQFTVRLLQSTYTDVSTNCISTATGTNGTPFVVDYPAAYLK